MRGSGLGAAIASALSDVAGTVPASIVVVWGEQPVRLTSPAASGRSQRRLPDVLATVIAKSSNVGDCR
jgi:hypothetical protein